MCKRHLGVVDDFALEQYYAQQNSLPQYDTLEQLRSYLQQFPRKSAQKLFLFGFQSIGGIEVPKNSTVEDALRSGGINHLFVDSNGFFCSG